MTDKKKSSGMCKYQLGPHNWYDRGITYPAGSIVEVSADVVPSRTWTLLEGNPDMGSTRNNPNPLPDSPANAKSIQGQIQEFARSPQEGQSPPPGSVPAGSGQPRQVVVVPEGTTQEDHEKRAEEARKVAEGKHTVVGPDVGPREVELQKDPKNRTDDGKHHKK